jgi:hypothetical protein
MGMKRNVIIYVICFVCITTAFSIPQGVRDKAYEYRGYDELISNITPVGYQNRTYYWVKYSKTLVYSGSLLVDDGLHPVTDNETLIAFVAADIIHNNFGRAGVEQLRDFSRYYGSLADNIHDPSLGLVVNDSREISHLLSESSNYLERGVSSFSPDDAGSYLRLESMLMGKMKEAYRNVGDGGNSSIVSNYRDSLANIYDSLTLNREGLLESCGFITKNILSRVSSREEGSETEMILIVAAVLLLVLVSFIQRSKRKSAN